MIAWIYLNALRKAKQAYPACPACPACMCLTVAGFHATYSLMKFLKVLINSMISGLFFAGLLALLTLDININLPFEAAAFGELALALALPYGTIVLVTVLSLFFIVQFFTGKRLAIKAISS